MKMLLDLSIEAGKVGLCIHPGKTKIIFNEVGRRGGPIPAVAEVAGHDIEVLAADKSTAHLGIYLNLQDRTSMAQESGIVYRGLGHSSNPIIASSQTKLIHNVAHEAV